MRKRTTRTMHPISSFITPALHSELILIPCMHLEMVLTQATNLDYQHSVLGGFNLGVALSHLKSKLEMQHEFEAAQQIMVNLIAEARCPTHEEGVRLRQCFNLADRTIGTQSKLNLIRAIELIDRPIAGGLNEQSETTS